MVVGYLTRRIALIGSLYALHLTFLGAFSRIFHAQMEKNQTTLPS
jgi:hypothetical protein